ncbi:phage neck terminator protein [Serratia aquatilis]|uniref:LIC_12616 family protein n=1 Tax=Serratia aquatilis TaxID=1737515 RepID=A0ABV6EEJ5_9GAMM
MQNIDELNPLFRQLVSLASGVMPEHVILADQGRSTELFGLELYATYNPIPIRAYGQTRHVREVVAAVEPTEPTLGDDWTDFSESACTAMEFMLSVNFFNAGASNAAMKLQNANFRAPISEYLFLNQIAWRYASAPRYLSAQWQAGIQPRYQTDIQLFVEHAVPYNVLRAAGVDILTHE